jgi:hypothetical protein
MSAFSAAAWIGSRLVRPTTAQLDQIGKYDAGLYQVGMDNLLRHLHYFVFRIGIGTTINANTVSSMAHLVRVPLKVVAMEVGCESAAGSACTGDVEKAAAATPTSFSTMSTGAVDVKTGAGVMQDLPVLSGHEDVEYGDRLRTTFAATGSGAVVGAQAVLHCFRR